VKGPPYRLTGLGRDRAAAYLDFALKKARLHFGPGPEFADAAADAVVECAALHDESRGVRFATHLASVVGFRCLDALEASRRPDPAAPGAIPMPDVAAPAAPDRSGLAELADLLLSSLPPRDAALLRAAVMGGEPDAAVAARLGLNPLGFRRARARALARLRRHPAARAIL
jgi:DNA-directed RNA polymerase specialized sigma24 family protein